MPVAKARAFIHQFLQPVSGTVRVPIRAALGRVLEDDPSRRWTCRPTATPRWTAGRCAARTSKADGETVARGDRRRRSRGRYVRRGRRARPMRAHHDGRHVVPEGADPRRDAGARAGRRPGKSVSDRRAGRRPARTCAKPARTSSARIAVALKRSRVIRPAELGLIASLGIGEVAVYRPLRVAFFSTGDELKSVGTPLGDLARSTTPTATRCTACSRASAWRSSTWAWCATTQSSWSARSRRRRPARTS